MTLGESNLERNSLEIFQICLGEEGEPEACKEIAIDYAEDKAKQIQDYFTKQVETGRLSRVKENEYMYRRNTAIPDALGRTKEKLNELTEEISV